MCEVWLNVVKLYAREIGVCGNGRGRIAYSSCFQESDRTTYQIVQHDACLSLKQITEIIV